MGCRCRLFSIGYGLFSLFHGDNSQTERHNAKVNTRILGTTSVQSSERKNGALAAKRHQMKHLGF